MARCYPSIWKIGSRVATWTEKNLVYSWGPYPTMIPNCPIRRRAIENVSVNPHTLACRENHERLQRIRVERRQDIEREIHAQIIQEICDGMMHPPTMAGSKSPTPTDKLRTLSTM